MSVPGPDLGAFHQAQKRLIYQQGTPVVLLIPIQTRWATGTPLDPDSGLPMDPFVAPMASGWTQYACSAAVAYRVAYRRFENPSDALGPHLRQPGALIIDNDDYVAGGSAATRAILDGGDTVQIYRWVSRGAGGAQQWLTWIQERE